MRKTEVIPLNAQGNSSIIRKYASNYSGLQEPVARNVPNLILWAILSCSQQRAILTNTEYASNEGTRRQMIDDLKTKTKDLMMYVGFLRYRLPASVYDTLVRVAAE